MCRSQLCNLINFHKACTQSAPLKDPSVSLPSDHYSDFQQENLVFYLEAMENSLIKVYLVITPDLSSFNILPYENAFKKYFKISLLYCTVILFGYLVLKFDNCIELHPSKNIEHVHQPPKFPHAILFVDNCLLGLTPEKTIYSPSLKFSFFRTLNC